MCETAQKVVPRSIPMAFLRVILRVLIELTENDVFPHSIGVAISMPARAGKLPGIFAVQRRRVLGVNRTVWRQLLRAVKPDRAKGNRVSRASRFGLHLPQNPPARSSPRDGKRGPPFPSARSRSLPSGAGSP